ncbi:MAG: GYD domain-containing protein [Devosia sp.]|nr:GYD domain-containing protein [Devosia sp.]
MAKYILLINWTEQGVQNVKNSPARWDAAKEVARKHGATFETIYMTMGEYDLVTILDAPNDEAVAKITLQVAMGGNIRTRTLKAFAEADYRKIIGSL